MKKLNNFLSYTSYKRRLILLDKIFSASFLIFLLAIVVNVLANNSPVYCISNGIFYTLGCTSLLVLISVRKKLKRSRFYYDEKYYSKLNS